MKQNIDVALLWLANAVVAFLIQSKDVIVTYGNLLLIILSVIYMTIKIFIAVFNFFQKLKNLRKEKENEDEN